MSNAGQTFTCKDPITFRSATDMTSENYRFVVMSEDRTVADAGAGVATIGIRHDGPDGSSVEKAVKVYTTKGQTALLTIGSGGCTYGQNLKSDANGAGVVASSDKDYRGAVALMDASENDVIEVMITGDYVAV
jgi:hypothetical protein